MHLAQADGPSLGGGHGEISPTDFELLGLKEPPSQTNFPAHLAADRATGEVLHDLAIVQTRLRFRGHKLATHHPVIEPVSEIRVRNGIFRCRDGGSKSAFFSCRDWRGDEDEPEKARYSRDK